MYQIPEGIVYLDELEVKLFDGRDHRVLFNVPDATMELMMVGRAAIVQNYHEVHHTANVLHGDLRRIQAENDRIVCLPDRFVQMGMFSTRISFDGSVWQTHAFSTFGFWGPYNYGKKYIYLQGKSVVKYSTDGIEWKEVPPAVFLGYSLLIQDAAKAAELPQLIDVLGLKFLDPYRDKFVGIGVRDIYLIFPDGSWKKESLDKYPTGVVSDEDNLFIADGETVYIMTEFNVFVPVCPGRWLHQTEDHVIAMPFRIVASKKWTYQRHHRCLPRVRLFARLMLLSFIRSGLSLVSFLDVMSMTRV